MAARAATTRTRDGLGRTRQRQKAPRRRRARLAQLRSRRGQGGPHPNAPFVVLEDRCYSEHCLLDGREAPRVDSVPNRLLAQPQLRELPPGDAIELPASELGDVSVLHSRL